VVQKQLLVPKIAMVFAKGEAIKKRTKNGGNQLDCKTAHVPQLELIMPVSTPKKLLLTSFLKIHSP
jgi:hypothetical protein